jgi:hypothetical protein
MLSTAVAITLLDTLNSACKQLGSSYLQKAQNSISHLSGLFLFAGCRAAGVVSNETMPVWRGQDIANLFTTYSQQSFRSPASL